MPSQEEQGLVTRVCIECGQGYMGSYVDRLCRKCRYKFWEKDKVLQLQGKIIEDSYPESYLG